MKLRLLFSVLLLIAMPAVSVCQEASQPNRRLFIHGGASIPKSSRAVFVEMAGGNEANLVVVPTATSDRNLPTIPELKKLWGEYGVENILILHTRDPLVANDPEFSKPLANATAVWFGGGDQRRLSQAYAQTEFERTLLRRVDQGLVVGGSSAGAAIQSRFMISGGRNRPQMAMGLNLLPNSIVDQHFLERSRLNRLARATEAHPERLGVGISENTTLVVDGSKSKVLGPGFVITMQNRGGTELDIRAWNSDSKMDIDFMASDHRIEVHGLKGVEDLFANNDEMDSFLLDGTRKAETFRQAWLKPSQLEPRMTTLGRLVQKFLDEHAQLANEDAGLRKAFPCSVESFERGFIGSKKDDELGLIFSSVFHPFAGQWRGQWAERVVEHQWSSTMLHSRFGWQGLRYRMFEPELIKRDFQILRYQYAWIGDGYGFNMVVAETDGEDTREYILGYVEHIEDNDFSKVVARRPHVGVWLGQGRLVWVTEKEVFFEEAFGKGDTRAYSIIGFRYETSSDRMIATEGFQTQYQRQKKDFGKTAADSQFFGANKFKTFPLAIEEQRKQAEL